MRIKEVLLLSVFLLTGCSEEALSDVSPDNQIKEVYLDYKQNGGTLDYADWLDRIKSGKVTDARSITSIIQSGIDGNKVTYTIIYSDGSTSDFTVTNGTDGHTPVITIDEDGYWCIDGDSIGVKAKGENGADGKGILDVSYEYDEDGNTIISFSFTDGTNQKILLNKGEAGRDGISSYLGFDGYYYNGSKRTDYQAQARLEDGVLESSIGISDVMKDYFPYSYLDLSKNTLALMSDYQPYSCNTRFSDSHIEEVALVSENDGCLYVGKGNVNDVIESRNKGSSFDYLEGKMVTLKKGNNIVKLDLTILEKETLVLGGMNSTAKLFAAYSIPSEDESGTYALLDSSCHDSVIEERDGHDDRIAIKVKGNFKVFENILESSREVFPSSMFASSPTYYRNNGPYVYADLDYFSGKRLTGIDIPIREVSQTGSHFFTIYVIDKNDLKNKCVNLSTAKKIYPVFPESELEKKNSWIHGSFDVTLGEEETLAFSSSDDRVQWVYQSKGNKPYFFYATVRKSASSISGSNPGIYFTLTDSSDVSREDHHNQLLKKEEEEKKKNI